MMNAETFSHQEEGILEVYKNEKWLLAIKNWRAANDISNISRLEVHFKTDEQFVLISGKAALIYAEDLNEESEIHCIPMEIGKVHNIPKGLWFNNVLSADAKLVYIEDSDTKAAPDNSIYRNLTPQQICRAKEKVAEALGL